jgi:hypothetical protein
VCRGMPSCPWGSRGAARDADLWDFVGSPGLGWRREDLIDARQQMAMPRVLKLGHLISRHSPSEGRVSA